MNNLSEYLPERFWSKVNVCEKIRCWEFRGSKNNGGYGNFRHQGKTMKAARVAFFLRKGYWPRNACHSCDNPACCNPDHIFDGSHKDNMQDMVKKGRNKADRGEKHGGAVLTDKAVIEIRTAYKNGSVSMAALATQFGCSFSTIQRVIKRTNWTHLP